VAAGADAAQASPINVMFILQNAPAARARLQDVAFEPITSRMTVAKADLTVAIVGTETATFEYRTDLFEHASIERMAHHFLYFAGSALARPDVCLDDLAIMSEAEGFATVHFEQAAQITDECV
jgi:non-ribosomal peptide synthetase component F